MCRVSVHLWLFRDYIIIVLVLIHIELFHIDDLSTLKRKERRFHLVFVVYCAILTFLQDLAEHAFDVPHITSKTG